MIQIFWMRATKMCSWSALAMGRGYRVIPRVQNAWRDEAVALGCSRVVPLHDADDARPGLNVGKHEQDTEKEIRSGKDEV